MTSYQNNFEITVKNLLAEIGKKIVIGVPLGIGKPIGLLNALYSTAEKDSTIDLTIITGLTLARPIVHNELERRFITPIIERVLQDYEDPLYEKARVEQTIPANIRIIEFFLSPGKYLYNNYVQQNYISSKYTSVVRDSLHYSVNVYAQQVAQDGDLYSLSCNTDLFHDVITELMILRERGQKIAIIAEVNANLPFMSGPSATVSAATFTHIIDTKQYHALFALPKEETSAQDHLIGIYTSALIPDDACLQIGIGKISNAVANALILRHKDNASYQTLLKKLQITEKFGINHNADLLGTFEQGLYASTEMMSDEYIELYKNNILKKKVYDHLGLQTLLNSQQITETIPNNILDILLQRQIIHEQLTLEDFNFLQHFGILTNDISYQQELLFTQSGNRFPNNINLSKQQLLPFLGKKLKNGTIIHAGFFIGSNDFYQTLRTLPKAELDLFTMTSIARTNTLQWSPALLKAQRRNARFVNSAIMVTLGGVLISDGLENLQELSGVGGQFDFVSMAHELDGARSIINCHATRVFNNTVCTNVLWGYSNHTISRYLRDIVVTEYGIADCRSKTDAEVIQAILNITDSRFQKELLSAAKKSGKIANDYEIPAAFTQNYPEQITPIIHELQTRGYCSPYPFGGDLTEQEQIIQKALLFLKNHSKFKLFLIFLIALFHTQDKKIYSYLIRMQLNHPKTIQEFFYKKILSYALKKTN